ncbi:Tetratricopeptide repeat protein 33 [Rhizophlyctis rosea]|uniref:Tetratricopeptide repeat protein 33 n=1 Tax=Rhizophlyctis rosea TaxID=64517 RepID=A0AAD5X1Z1_9FUNG|nr:Tetratricopeptide repeat protein 33 [Rhizophlyctis rosea]
MPKSQPQPQSKNRIRFFLAPTKPRSHKAPLLSLSSDEDDTSIPDTSPSQPRLLLLDPHTVYKTLLTEATTLAEASRHSEAIDRFLKALDLLTASPSLDSATTIPSESSKIHEMIAQIHLARNDSFLAIQSACQAISESPTWAEAHQTLGRAQMMFGEPVLALASFRKALELDPGSAEVSDEDLVFAEGVVRELERRGRAHARGS